MLPFRTAVLLLAAALLGGCAAPMRTSLTPELRASIKELDVRVVVVQDEVIVDVRPLNAAPAGVALGLIGALVTSTIDSAVTNKRVKSAQDLMGPFYQAIEDVDFRREFNEAVRPAMSGYALKVSSVDTTALGLSKAILRQWRDGLGPARSLMVIVPRYTLSADFRTFDVETIVTIWRKDGDDLPINRGVLRYQSAPTGPGDKDSVLAWSVNNAAAFRAAIKEAVAETMHLVRTDLDVIDATAKPEALREVPFNSGSQQASVKGRLVSETAARVTLLGNDGKLYSLPKPTAVARH